jgi:hypothetical protein
MKHLTIAATLILAGVIAYGVAAYAQPAGTADPVKVDPKHYKVEFENESGFDEDRGTAPVPRRQFTTRATVTCRDWGPVDIS